jgi:hypothetical protein
MWVRPATDWWGRMNAGESPRNQGRSVWPPLSVSIRRSRGRRKNAAVERRKANAQRHWACAARRLKCYPRLSAPRSLTSGEQGNAGAPRASREQGRRSFVVLPAGCLKCESDIAHESAGSVLAERTRECRGGIAASLAETTSGHAAPQPSPRHPGWSAGASPFFIRARGHSQYLQGGKSRL